MIAWRHYPKDEKVNDDGGDEGLKILLRFLEIRLKGT